MFSLVPEHVPLVPTHVPEHVPLVPTHVPEHVPLVPEHVECRPINHFFTFPQHLAYNEMSGFKLIRK